MVVQLMTWPWKTPLINLADGAMSMMPGTQGSFTSWGLFKHREIIAGIESGLRGCGCCAYASKAFGFSFSWLIAGRLCGVRSACRFLTEPNLK